MMKHARKWLVMVALGASLGFTWVAHAEEETATGADGQQYQRKTVINFEDDTIEGDLKTPDGEYLEAKKKARHKSLIKIRENFRRQVLQSAGNL